MRRIALAVIAALGVGLCLVIAGLPVSAAWAAPSPAPVPSAAPAQPVCTVDSALAGITGLVATANGYAVVVKQDPAIIQRVYILDAECKRTKSLNYSAKNNNPQDLQASADGTLWVADTGDSLTNPSRPSIALWKFPPDGGKSTLFRFSYPETPRSAQAMLMTPDGNPIFITDSTKGPAGIYVPSGPLDPSGKAVPLKKAGDFTPQATNTDNTLGKIGQSRVSGAASSPDGKRIVLRTYSDAYEWTVSGDIVTTITTGTPRITPLTGEPLGEAISYTPDGSAFLTVSDVVNKQSSTPTQILKFKPATPTTPAQVKAGGGAVAPLAGKGDTRDWLGKLGFQDILNVIAGIGVVGVIMVVLGIVGIRRARRSPPTPARGRRDAYEDEYADPAGARSPARDRAAADRRRARVPERYDERYDANDYSAGSYEPQRYGYGTEYPPPEPEPRYSSGYGPPDAPEAYDPYGPAQSAPPSPAPPGPAPRSGGVARSHRNGRRDGRDTGRRASGGYSDEHQGFGDMLD
jgi:hypothetical protein